MLRTVVLFFRLLIWFSVRELLKHRWRTLAVLLGISLGASVFTSVRLSINASLESFINSMDIFAGKADWVVVRPGARVPDDLVATLLTHQAVQAASPLLTTYILPAHETPEPFMLIGLDPILDRPLRSWRIEKADSEQSSLWIELLSTPYTLIASQRLAEKYHLAKGGRLILEHVQQKGAFRVIGTLASQGLALVDGGNVALVDISTMQEFMGLHGLVDRIDLLLRPTATDADVQEIQAMLPKGITIERPSEAKESGILMIRAYQLNLSLLSFVSLFVGMYLVYSLVALHAASRRHELAILRSVGASSRLLFLLFLAEGAFFGFFGWVMAIPISSFLVRQLLERISYTITNLFVRVHVDRLELDSWELLLSFLITILISVAASYQPAREAMKVAPREALLLHDIVPKQRKSFRRLAIFGLLLITLAWPLSQLPSVYRLPIPGYLSTLFLFLGFSLLSPLFLHVMGACLPSLLRRFAGQPGYLAGRYVRDTGIRTAISVAALITAVALFIGLVIMVHSFRKTVEIWVHQTISADLFLRPSMAGINHYRDPLPPVIVERLKRLQTPADFIPYRQIRLRYGKVPYQFQAFDFARFMRYGSLLFLRGDPKDIMPEFNRGRGVLVSEVFSNQTGLTIGDRYRAQIEGVTFDLPILGVFRDYRTQGGIVYCALPFFREYTGDRSWSGVRIYFHDRNKDLEAAAAELRGEIIACCGQDHALEITIGGSLRREILRIFDETFAVTTVLLLIALLVAALGITTTLTVLVLERTQQLHTLVAVGASFGQIRAMIFWEAILLVTAGECLGLGCGFLLSHLLVFVINRQSFGWTFMYSVEWPVLLSSLPLILMTALLGALPAIKLAFRQPHALALRDH